MGRDEIVKLLLNQGANDNAQGGKYGNALEVVWEWGHEEIVKLLLDWGADVNTKSGHSQTARCVGFRDPIPIQSAVRLRVEHGGGDGGNPILNHI